MDGESVVDALIVTARREELDALLAVETGRRGEWVEVDGDPPRHVAHFETDGGPVRLVVVHSPKMGVAATAHVTASLARDLHPRSLAMCGVCAGHPEDTALGDVVIADRVFDHDKGKLKPTGLASDLDSYRLDNSWLYPARAMCGAAAGMPGYADPTGDGALWWVLEELLAGRAPHRNTAWRRYVPDDLRPAFVHRLIDELGYARFKGDGYALTRAGKKAIREHLLRYGALATRLPFHVHVGPIGSGSYVAADAEIWARIADNGMRKILAIEMEAAAIGQVAFDRKLPFLVVKGVMDHADKHKSDRFKGFAARASAEVLCAMLRRTLARDVQARPTGDSATASTWRLLGKLDQPSAAEDRGASDAGYRPGGAQEAAVVEHLRAVLGKNRAVADRLAKAHDPWAAAAKKGIDELVDAIVSVAPTTLAAAFLAAMLEVSPSPGADEAEVLVDVFERVLPLVAARMSPLGETEGGRMTTAVRLAQTVEPMMAWATTPAPKMPRLELRKPTEPGGHPKPRFYLDIEHVPEPGATTDARMDVIKREERIKRASIAKAGEEWHRREGGLAEYMAIPDEDEKAVQLDESVGVLHRPIYTLVREPDEKMRAFMDLCRRDLKSLCVVEAWPDKTGVRDDYQLLNQIRRLYQCFHAAGGGLAQSGWGSTA